MFVRNGITLNKLGENAMKILHINGLYLLSKLHQNMIRALAEYNEDNEVVSPIYDAGRSIVNPDSNVTVTECFKKWDRLFFLYKQSKIINSIKKLYDISDFDCIHSYTLFTDGNSAMELSKEYGVPYVTAVRATDVNAFFKLRPHLRGRGIEIMRNASAVFFLSEMHKREVFDKYVPKKLKSEIEAKTYIMPNGIDDFWLKNTKQKEKAHSKDIKLMYAGRIIRIKNIPIAQKAVKILRDSGYNVSLTVVGTAKDKRLFEKIKSDPYTTCIPAMSKEELIKMYAKNDIFVMASVSETFGLVYAEAMSQGMPIIYSKGQGFDGQFPEGYAGYAVRCGSAEEIADAVLKITENYDEISKNCVKGALRFDWSRLAEQYYDIYKKIVNK